MNQQLPPLDWNKAKPLDWNKARPLDWNKAKGRTPSVNPNSFDAISHAIGKKVTRQDVMYERRISKVAGENPNTGWQGVLVKIEKNTSITNKFMGELVKHFSVASKAALLLRDNAKEDKEEKTFYNNKFLAALQKMGLMSEKKTVFGNIIESLLMAVEKITLAGMVVLGGLLVTAYGAFADKIAGVWNDLKADWSIIWKNVTEKGWAMWESATNALWSLAKPFKATCELLQKYFSGADSAAGWAGG